MNNEDLIPVLKDFLSELEPSEYLKIIPKGKSFYDAIMKFQNHLEAQKIKLFLEQLDSLNESQISWIKKTTKSETKQKKFGQKLLLVLRSFTDLEKAVILGKITKEATTGIITKENYMRLLDCLQKVRLEDLDFLNQRREETYFKDGYQARNLFLTGLLRQYMITKKSPKNVLGNYFGQIENDPRITIPIVYEHNELSTILLKYGLEPDKKYFI
jgi:hypothetical protein